MTTDFRALCAELAEKLDEFDRLLHGAQYVEHPLTYRARAALAEPQPEPPTDDGMIPNCYLGNENQVYRDGFHAGYRYALTRVDLAEPQPNPPADGEVGELVVWLLDGGEDAAANGWDHQARQFGRAAELLQRLKPAPPTKAELKQLFDDHSGYINDEQVMWWSDFHAAARAVLARWGNHPGSPDSSTQPTSGKD